MTELKPKPEHDLDTLQRAFETSKALEAKQLEALTTVRRLKRSLAVEILKRTHGPMSELEFQRRLKKMEE